MYTFLLASFVNVKFNNQRKVKAKLDLQASIITLSALKVFSLNVLFAERKQFNSSLANLK